MGATDSAAPCAMLMYIAKAVDGFVSRMYDEMQALEEGGTVEMDMGIQILLLDGEEAFERWSDDDSLYGSRYVSLDVVHSDTTGPTWGLCNVDAHVCMY